MTERIIYEVTVPASERHPQDDTPEAYRVVKSAELPSCMVYGRYSRHRPEPEWIANPSCRWLVRHLIGKLQELEWKDESCEKSKEVTCRTGNTATASTDSGTIPAGG